MSTVQLVISHAVCMMTAFGVLMPCAVLAKIYRRTNNTWFYIHIAFNMTGILLAFSGFVLGISAAKDGNFTHIHPIMGLTTMSLVMIQPLNAAIRPFHEESRLRTAWRWTHKITGQLILCTSSMTIALGIRYAYQLEYYNSETYKILAITYLVYSSMVGILMFMPLFWSCCKTCDCPVVLTRDGIEEIEMGEIPKTN